MPLRNTATRYGSVARCLHWTSVGLVVWLYVDVSRLGSAPGVAERAAVVDAHVTFGLLVLALMLARLGWRLANPNPAAAYVLPQWYHAVVFGVHRGLYALVIVECLLGVWALTAGPPVPGAAARAGEDAASLALEFHDAAALALLLLVLVHATAAVLNQIFGVVPESSDDA